MLYYNIQAPNLFHGRECSILNNNHDRETWWHKKKRINTLIIRRRSDILFWAQPCLTAESEPIFRFILCTFPLASFIFHKSSPHFQHFSYSVYYKNLYLKDTIYIYIYQLINFVEFKIILKISIYYLKSFLFSFICFSYIFIIHWFCKVDLRFDFTLINIQVIKTQFT